MPTKRMFDLAHGVAILFHAALGPTKMVARRWQRESNGVMGVVGSAIRLATGS